MRHDERHAALAAYAFWSKLEQTGLWKNVLLPYYETLFDAKGDFAICPACVIAKQEAAAKVAYRVCDACPCDWGSAATCISYLSPYIHWRGAPHGTADKKKYAGDVANIMRKWCERVGVIAPREESK